MDRIPLINPKLVKVSATAERAPESVIRAEVISSTPTKESVTSQAKNTQQQEYKVVLKVGQQQLETISNTDVKKGSLLDVKILPGPELKIINGDLKTQIPPSLETSSAKILAQQLLADRIPKIQQQELPNLIKQLSQIINANPAIPKQPPASLLLGSMPTASSQSSISNPAILTDNKRLGAENGAKFGAGPTNQQALASQAYSRQSNLLNTALSPSNTLNSASSTALQDVKAWLQQLPKENDIITTTGLRNALTNAGPQAEKQLSILAQQSLNFSGKTSANSIFQQLQSLQNTSQKELNTVNTQSNNTTSDNSRPSTDLTSIIKRTAKVLSDNSQALLSSLTHTKASHTKSSHTNSLHTSISQTATSQPGANSFTPEISASSLLTQTTSQWQNPLLNNSALSLDDLLNAPLLQNPSSNNKFALSQILTGHNELTEGSLKVPLNWPERSGNDTALIRNLQNLLGHIEREQVQQMQLSEANQSNNPNQLQQSQQWIPLLINHQQQLQLIEFYMDKEERLDQAGEKKNHWFINLHFNLPKLGQLGIEITMIDNECNTTFWSESKSTLNQLSNHIQPLRQRLTEQGIIVSDIQPRHGTLEKRKHNIQQRLVDVKT